MSKKERKKSAMAQINRGEILKGLWEKLIGSKNFGLKAFFYACLVIVIGSWIPELITRLLEYIQEILLLNGNTIWIIKLVLTILIMLYFFISVKKVIHDRSQIKVIRGKPSPHKILVVFLSTLGSKTNMQKDNLKKLEENLEKNLIWKEILYEKCPWEMPLISIEHHQEKLQKLYVITSKQDKINDDQGSSVAFPLFKELALKVKPGLQIEELTTNGIDFEDIEVVFNLIQAFYQRDDIRQIEKKGNGVIIDITGGQKTNSIVGAIATLSTERQFQYVSTRTKEVYSYDVAIQPESK